MTGRHEGEAPERGFRPPLTYGRETSTFREWGEGSAAAASRPARHRGVTSPLTPPRVSSRLTVWNSAAAASRSPASEASCPQRLRGQPQFLVRMHGAADRVHVLDRGPHLEVGVRADIVLNRRSGESSAITEKQGTIAIATIGAVQTTVGWIRMLSIRLLGSGVFGVHLHHEEEPLSSQSTRTTPGML